MKKKEYDVIGECEIHRTKVGRARAIVNKDIVEFWETFPDVKKKKGVYIFALTWKGSFMPYYVGKASKNYGQEIFGPQKLVKYNYSILKSHGNAVFFFVVQQGTRNDNLNRKVEIFLTAMCYKRNPHIQNIQNKKEDKWFIKGVLNHKGQGKGKISTDSKKLKLCLGL